MSCKMKTYPIVLSIGVNFFLKVCEIKAPVLIVIMDFSWFSLSFFWSFFFGIFFLAWARNVLDSYLSQENNFIVWGILTWKNALMLVIATVHLGESSLSWFESGISLEITLLSYKHWK